MDYPDSDRINPDQAKLLFKSHCAFLIVEDLPIGSEIGIDMMVHRVGEKFKGIKLIPPGLRFIYASSIDRYKCQSGPRCGFFHDFKIKELFIIKWSQIDEDFDDSFEPSEEHRERYLSNLEDLDRYLGTYSFTTYRTYLSLTSELTSDLVRQMMPEFNRIRSVPYLVRGPDKSEPNESFSQKKTSRRLINHPDYSEESLLPELNPDHRSIMNLTKIPSNHIESGHRISGSTITEYNLDTTMKLEQTFEGAPGRQSLLAELQFSFITFLLCHKYECFEHWKKLLQLICLADSGLEKFPTFFVNFVRILKCQLDQVPEDLFENIEDSKNLVRTLLDAFFSNSQTITDSILRHEALILKKHLENKFGWSFNLERDDELPVVVNLD